MKTKLFVPIALLALFAALVIVGCATAPTSMPAASSASASSSVSPVQTTPTKVAPTATTPAGIPPVAVAPGLAVAPAIAPARTVKYNVLVGCCADGRILEETAGTRTNVRYIHSIAGVPPQNLNDMVLFEESRIRSKFDLIVVGTHDGFCGVAGCGGQELLDKLMKDPNFQVAPELQQTREWVRTNIKSPNALIQALADGEEVVRLTGGQRNVLVTVFNTSDQKYYPVRAFITGQPNGWSRAVTLSEWTAAETAGWKEIPTILREFSMPESAQAFLADNRIQAPALSAIARARNFKIGQTFPEVIITNSLRPVSERLGVGSNQGERFIVTLAEGMSPTDVNAQVAYALAHSKPGTNVRFLMETGEYSWGEYFAAADANPAFQAWMRNPAMKGKATFEIWHDLFRVTEVTLRPDGVPIQSFLMRLGVGGGAMVLMPGVFFEAAKLATRDAVVGAQSTYSPNGAANTLSKEFGLELSPVYRINTGPDAMTMWSQLINRVPGGQEKACIKRALTDVSGSLILVQQDIPTMLSICPSVWPPTQELNGAAIVYAVPGSSQEPITIAYRDGKWIQASGTTLQYQLRVTNKAGIPFQAVFQMAIENGKEIHRFVKLTCLPPSWAYQQTVLPVCKN